MAKKKSGGLGVAMGIIGAAGAAIGVIEPLVDMAGKIVDKAHEHQKEPQNDGMVKVPQLYSKEFPIALEQAIELLENCGLKYLPIAVTIKEAEPRFKDCFNHQIIFSNPRQGSSVKVGDIICLKYATDEVINESQRLFDEEQQFKEEASRKKKAAKLKRAQQREQAVVNIANKAKAGGKKIFRKSRKEKSEWLDE